MKLLGALLALLVLAAPAEAAFGLVNKTGAMSSNGGVSVTTPGIDTTGTTLLIVNAAQISTTSAAPTDNKGNTWIPLNASVNGAACRSQLYYAVPTVDKVGSGHTFSLNPGAGSFPSLTVSAFSGGTASVDFLRGSTSATATASPGSITPYGSNELFVAAACHDGLYASTGVSGFTITDDEVGSGSNAYGNTMAYLIQGAASAVNPTFSGDGSSHQWAAKIAAFKLGGPVTRTLTLADCTQALLQDAHDSAADNPSAPDTIQLPACSATWTTDLILTKSLIIKGTGDGSIERPCPCTIIGYNHSAPGTNLIKWNLSAGAKLRVSGIKFIYAGAPDAGGGAVLWVSGPESAIVRFDHLTDDDIQVSYFIVFEGVIGVADHLTCLQPTQAYYCTKVVHAGWGGAAIGNGSYAAALQAGTDQAMYVEDSTFIVPFTGKSSLVDGDEGSRSVVRKNTSTGSQIVHEGVRGARLLEAYDNFFDYTNTQLPFGGGPMSGNIVGFRSGTGFVFNNRIKYVIAPQGPAVVLQINRHTHTNWITWGGCDGTRPYDLNNTTGGTSGNGIYASSEAPYNQGVAVAGSGLLTLVITGSQGWTDNQWQSSGAVSYTLRNLDRNSASSGFPEASFILSNTYNAGTGKTTIIVAFGGGAGGYINEFLVGQRWEIRRAVTCLDQPGGGLSDLMTADPATAVWPNQIKEPIYAFNNAIDSPYSSWLYGEVEESGLDTRHLIQPNVDWYSTAGALSAGQCAGSFNGTCGVGVGVIASRPATCTAGVGYWATNEGSWNTRLPENTSGRLYKCTATNTWTLYYTPYTYPHPLRGSGALADAASSTPVSSLGGGVKLGGGVTIH